MQGKIPTYTVSIKQSAPAASIWCVDFKNCPQIRHALMAQTYHINK